MADPRQVNIMNHFTSLVFITTFLLHYAIVKPNEKPVMHFLSHRPLIPRKWVRYYVLKRT